MIRKRSRKFKSNIVIHVINDCSKTLTFFFSNESFFSSTLYKEPLIICMKKKNNVLYKKSIQIKEKEVSKVEVK